MFQALKSLISNLNPLNIIMDYEERAMNVLKFKFPKAFINGCFLNLSQYMQVYMSYKTKIIEKNLILHYIPKDNVFKVFKKL